jgi:hypothetical protein
MPDGFVRGDHQSNGFATCVACAGDVAEVWAEEQMLVVLVAVSIHGVRVADFGVVLALDRPKYQRCDDGND